jgi:hypothetical protein
MSQKPSYLLYQKKATNKYIGGIRMPLPKPKKEEKQTEFIRRCMDDPVMKTENPKENQRLAICYSLWRTKNDK